MPSRCCSHPLCVAFVRDGEATCAAHDPAAAVVRQARKERRLAAYENEIIARAKGLASGFDEDGAMKLAHAVSLWFKEKHV